MTHPHYFITGFPGFIASRLLVRLMETSKDSHFTLLVHPSQWEKAQTAIRDQQRVELLRGDITEPNLMLPATITHVMHLAAIYDLATPERIAHLVNVTGTKHMDGWLRKLPNLQRYLYFSTAYVSGDRTGKILETELDRGQKFKNHYESTKFKAEQIVQASWNDLPTTIVRPGIVIGDSKSGETAKFDGPYFIFRFLKRFGKLPLPYIGKASAPINLVPVNYIVDAAVHLLHSKTAEKKIFHLTDPAPYSARRVYEHIDEILNHKTPHWTLPEAIVATSLEFGGFRRWLAVPRETLAYFRCFAEYDSSNAQAELQPAGISCPDFFEYLPVINEFFLKNHTNPEKIISVQ